MSSQLSSTATSGTSPRIQCIAIISSTNSPLYIRSFGNKDEPKAGLRYQFIAHSALDVIEERTASSRGAEQYLNLLLNFEDLAIYGFQTSTRTKFLVMLGLSDAVVKDLDMITIFRAIHTSYLSHLCNPFHSIPSTLLPHGKANHPSLPANEANLPPNRKPIQGSPMFERRMEKIVGWKPLPPEPVGEAA
ncbi:unnamed protein product [Sympodiomycopsis kandeliae]